MRNRLDKFNSLPPKPEHIRKVRAVLRASIAPIKLAQLVSQTGLTNTQALCALDLMTKTGEVLKEGGSNTFYIVNSKDEDG